MSIGDCRYAPVDHVRRMFVAVLAALCLAYPALTQDNPALAHERDKPTIPPQGLYEGCAPTTGDCAARLANIDSAGFELVLNYSSWYGTPAEVLDYADAAANLGLRLIWPLNHPSWRGAGSLSDTYPDLVDPRGHAANPDFLALAISLVANHPATWGFYIGDEVPPAEAGSVATLSTTVRQLAPGKPQLYVARPGAALLEPFATFADVAGVNSYPVGSDDPLVRNAARTTQVVVDRASARMAMVLQAFSWSQYQSRPQHFPSARALRAMREAVIHHSDPAMILWYSYQDILRSDRPQTRWRQLARAAFTPLRP